MSASEEHLSLTVKISIVVSLLLFVSEGINYSQLAPFFPNEAELNKAMNNSCYSSLPSHMNLKTSPSPPPAPAHPSPRIHAIFLVIAMICTIPFLPVPQRKILMKVFRIDQFLPLFSFFSLYNLEKQLPN